MQSKILVTGGAGYIGSHTCVELLNSDYEVIVLDNLSNSNVESLRRVEKITGKKIIFIQGDIRDKLILDKIFNEYEISAVMHFAGLKSVSESINNPVLYFDNNILGSISLIKAMQNAQVFKLIFSSSATVYDESNQCPLHEKMLTGKPKNPYGYTKLVVEQMLQDAATVDCEWSIGLLRYFNPIGAHPSGLIGEDPLGIPNNLLPYITQVAIGKLPELNIYGDDYDTLDGTGVRDYIHVVDLAKGHLAALKNRLNNKGCEIWNLGTGKGHSVLEVKNLFELVSKKTVAYSIMDRRTGDLAISFANSSKALIDLNWQCKYQLEDMLEHAWNWQVNNPTGYL